MSHPTSATIPRVLPLLLGNPYAKVRIEIENQAQRRGIGEYHRIREYCPACKLGVR